MIWGSLLLCECWMVPVQVLYGSFAGRGKLSIVYLLMRKKCYALRRGNKSGWIPHSSFAKPVKLPRGPYISSSFPILQFKSLSSTSSPSPLFPKHLSYCWFSFPRKKFSGLQCYLCLFVIAQYATILICVPGTF